MAKQHYEQELRALVRDLYATLKLAPQPGTETDYLAWYEDDRNCALAAVENSRAVHASLAQKLAATANRSR